MKPITAGRLGIALLAVLATLPAAADTHFRITKMTRTDVPLGKGQCDIRLRVAGEVDVAMRRDVVTLRSISGGEVHDDGSECNEPLPDRDIRDFSFDAKDSRNEVRLVEAPSKRNDWTAAAHIRGTAGGEGRYRFRLSWSLASSPTASRQSDEMRELARGGGLGSNNATHFNARGRGESTLNGGGPDRLSNAKVDIDQGGRIQITFGITHGQPITFLGSVIAREGEVIKADVAADERRLRLRGPMYLTIDGKENLSRITLEATNGQDRLHLNWDRR